MTLAMIVASTHPLVLTVSHDWPAADSFASGLFLSPVLPNCPRLSCVTRTKRTRLASQEKVKTRGPFRR
jgi:hypothetical protein